MPAVSHVGLACSQVDCICVVPWPCCAMRRARWRPRVGPPRTGRPAPRRSPTPTRMARSARPSDGPGDAGVGRPVVRGRHTGAAPRQHHSGLGRGGDRAQSPAQSRSLRSVTSIREEGRGPRPRRLESDATPANAARPCTIRSRRVSRYGQRSCGWQGSCIWDGIPVGPHDAPARDNTRDERRD